MGRKAKTSDDPETIKARIVDTAERLFRAMGYSKTAVGDIAKALGMSQSNVYRYFPLKASINEAICERIVWRIEERCEKAVDKSPDAREALRAVHVEYFRAVKDNVINGQHLYEMVVEAVAQAWPVIQRHVDRMDERVQNILARGVAEGVFKDMDVKRTSLAFQNAFSAFTYPALVERQIADAENQGGEERIEADISHLAEILVRGVAR